jgi:hypothetical protein
VTRERVSPPPAQRLGCGWTALSAPLESSRCSMDGTFFVASQLPPAPSPPVPSRCTVLRGSSSSPRFSRIALESPPQKRALANPASPTMISLLSGEAGSSHFERALCASRCKRHGTPRDTTSDHAFNSRDRAASNPIVSSTRDGISERASSSELLRWHMRSPSASEMPSCVRTSASRTWTTSGPAAVDHVARVPPGSPSGVSPEEGNI